ncbi:FMN-binding negative transcriptional regulator [Nocardia sp. NPDC060256]|uniref:FMN-binding negative transcriptional regulator n=1 Tax=unclassified Nocardia TaxID=2637762 RepID=UPI00365D7FBF
MSRSVDRITAALCCDLAGNIERVRYMFVPAQYREPDTSWLIDLIRQYPLAQLATNNTTADAPFITHLPAILDPAAVEEPNGDLSGIELLGHMNRANPHWQALRSPTPALLVFTGPHAYVSPTIYQVTPAAPTWNFTAVHVHGVLETIDSPEQTLDVVKATVTAYEKELGYGWDMSESIDYFHKLLPGVGAFRFSVSHAEGMFKLSQEQPPEVKQRVVRSFSDNKSGRHHETACLMRRMSGESLTEPSETR